MIIINKIKFQKHHKYQATIHQEIPTVDELKNCHFSGDSDSLKSHDISKSDSKSSCESDSESSCEDDSKSSCENDSDCSCESDSDSSCESSEYESDEYDTEKNKIQNTK